MVALPHTNRLTSDATTRSLVARLELDRVWLVCAVVASVLLITTFFLPLWQMTLQAPQYPGGLHLTAYGTRMEGDLSEINALNHYVGVKAIEPDSVFELRLFPFALFGIVGLVLLAGVLPVWRRLSLRWIATAVVWALPIGFLIDLQWWLYRYGHDLDPTAPFRLPEFTPKVIGTTRVMNFHAETMVTTGFWIMVAAAVLLTIGPWLFRFLRDAWQNTGTAASAVGLVVLASSAIGVGPAPPIPAPAVAPTTIQAAIDSASPGETVTIPAGTYHETIVVDKSITLIGEGWPTIDGRQAGDVVRVTADGVILRGFVVQGSSRSVSAEPGGIRLEGNNATVEGNRVADVLYGVILIGSHGHTIRGNDIVSILDYPTERRGHAVYLWNTSHNLIEGNIISDAKDGIFLGFATFNEIRGNHVTDVRYGIHYMYADDNGFFDNTFKDNLAGAAIMYSRRIELVGNVFSHNSSAASGYGLLLKDVDDVTLRGNLIHHNRVGLLMEGAPQSPLSFVRLEGNLIGYNQTALGLTTTTDATFVGNSFISNLQQVETRGASIENRNTWAEDGRGNYWDGYQGYDADGDGVGDIPFRYEGAYDSLVADNQALNAFKFTFAHTALDLTARWFPVYRPDARVVDPAPLMSPTITLPRESGFRAAIGSAAFGIVLLGLPAVGFWFARSTFRRRSVPC